MGFKILCNILNNETADAIINNGAFLACYLYDKTTNKIVVAKCGLTPPSLIPEADGQFMFPNTTDYPITGEKMLYLYAGNTLVGIFDHITFPEENTNT